MSIKQLHDTYIQRPQLEIIQGFHCGREFLLKPPLVIINIYII